MGGLGRDEPGRGRRRRHHARRARPRRRARADARPTSRPRRRGSSRRASRGRSGAGAARWPHRSRAVRTRSARRCCTRMRIGSSRRRLLAVGGQAFAAPDPHATYEDLFLPLFGVYAAHERRRRSRRLRGAHSGTALDEGPSARRWARALARTARGRRPRAPRSCSTARTTPAGAEALAEALARVVPLGSAARRAGGEREQGHRRDRGSARGAADVAYAARNDSVR